jgi:hypothetical protein
MVTRPTATLLTLGALLVSTAGAPPRFVVAIVRFDGRLVPFAAYDDGC